MAAAASSSTLCPGVRGSAGLLSSSSSARNGTALKMAAAPAPATRASRFVAVCRAAESAAEEPDVVSSAAAVSRRLAVALLAGSAAVAARASPALAAYGEGANIFAAPKPQNGFTSHSGKGWTVDVPSKWVPSKQVEFPGQVLRYEDNFDAVSNCTVSIVKADKSSITDYGSPENLLSTLSYLLGKQSYAGKTNSEGGFLENKVSTAAILDSQVRDVNGKTYYEVGVLTRTADGDEGGKHQLIVATIDGGKFYILKAQAGDKRWFKGAMKSVKGIASSFNVV